MMLEEAQARLKKTKITEEQLWLIAPIYCLLNFDKDDFCRLIDAIGLDKWLAKADLWERLDIAERDLSDKERYINAKARLEKIEAEKAELEEIIKYYKPI